MKRSFIIQDASDDMPPNEGEGAIHFKEEGGSYYGSY